MSLEQNSQQEQEEGPGAFLSLSAQAPSSSSSTSPFRAVEVSPREAVKQERGDLETCLSLQQPSQQALGQQTIAYLQEPQPSQALGHQTLAYLQEPQRSQALGQRTVPYLEGEQMTAAFSEQKTSSFAEQPGSSEHQKPSGTSEHLKLSSSEHEKSLSLEGFSEHQKPAALEGVSEHQKPESLQGLPEQQKPATWVGLLEQQKPVPFLGLSEQQKPASLLLLEQQKAAASLGFSPQQNPLTLQLISEQQKLGFSVQPNLMPPQGPQKVQKQLGFSEQQKLASPSEQEKPLPLQGPAQELNFAFPHRPQVSSLQPDQQKHASWQGHLFQGPLDEQKVVFSPKRPPEQQNFGSLQASPDQQKLNSSHVFSEQHKSAFMQAHALQGPSDQQKCSSLQGPSDQQKPESIQGHVEQQKAFPLLVTAEQQKTSYGHSLQPQRGFMVQPAPSVLQDKAGVLFSEPIVVSSPLGQDGLPKEKDYPLSRQSPRACLASPQGFEQVYPAPMATHSAVLADQRLFMETLQSLHAALGLQVSLPKIGEKDLDLHKLYKAVTCRGGLEVVIKDRKWKEVTLAFNCPPSVMTASCILRRSYISALHHYEQVYFFGAHGRIIPPPAAYATHSPALSEQEDASKFPQGIDELESRQNTSNGIVDSAQALGVDPASSVGATVTGAIDGKFENGYLVTVMVGARKMRGVLYHVASTNTLPQNACLPGMMQSVGSELKSADLAPAVGRKRRKTEVFRKDPNAPRQNRTGYNFFFAEQRAKLKTMQPDKDRAISKMIGELWNKLSEDEKIPYQAQGVKDKERYVREMKEYKEKIKLPLISVEASNDSKAVPPRLMSNDSKAVPPRIPLTHISETSNDSKAMPPRFPLTNMSEASNDFKAAPSQLPLTNMSEASNDSAVPPRLTYTSEALNVSQALLGNANRPNVATVVNTPNAAIVRTQKDSTVLVDTSVALTVDMSNASTDGNIPKSQVELPPSDRTSSHNPAGFEAHVQREEHTSPMEQ